MNKKIKDFVNAAEIISQLPPSEVKVKAVNDLFEKRLPQLGLPTDSYIHRTNEKDGVRTHHFIYSSEDDDYDVAINVSICEGKVEFNIVSSIC